MNHNNLYNYQYYHVSKNFQTNPERTLKLIEPILKLNPRRVLDVGAGLGSVVNYLREHNIEAYGIDLAEILKSIWGAPFFSIGDAKNLPFPDKSFDVVFSSDFFEHIPEGDIDQIVNEMKRVGTNIITFVVDSDGKSLTKRQRNFHVTNYLLTWWRDKLNGVDVYSSRINEN